jgi:hypothetical protein
MSLQEALKVELSSIPLEHWPGHFPCIIAILRFLECARPGTVRLERAGVDEGGPYYSGAGVGWFLDTVWEDPDVRELADAIMLEVVVALRALPRDPDGMDFVRHDRLPPLPANQIDRLEGLVLSRVDAAPAGTFG